MIVSICVAAAIAHRGPVHASPHFKLSYSADLVGIDPSDESAQLSHITVRYEKVPGTKWCRYVRTTDGVKSILQFLDGKYTVSTIQPNGSANTKVMQEKEFATAFMQGLGADESQMKELGKSTNDKKENVFKMIAGIKCQKHVWTFTFGDQDYEMVNFSPVDTKINNVLGQFESYAYSVNGDTKTLTHAETVVAFRMGSK